MCFSQEEKQAMAAGGCLWGRCQVMMMFHAWNAWLGKGCWEGRILSCFGLSPHCQAT